MKMNEENVSLVMLSRDTDVSPDIVECQKITHNEYRHKKFKRIASAEIEVDYNQEEQSHINETQPNILDNELLTKEDSHLNSQYRFVFNIFA